MGHARAVEIELAPESGAPPFVVTGGPRLVTCWPEGRTRATVAQGWYVDLIALPVTGYVPVGPSDLVDVVRAAADVDEVIEDARTRRSEPNLTLRVTPAGRDIHAEMGLLTLPKIRAQAEARSSVSVTMDNANASQSEDMTADVATESSVAVDMEAYGEVAAVAEGQSSMAVDMQAYGEVAAVAAGESSVAVAMEAYGEVSGVAAAQSSMSATMDDANATTMPTPSLELDFEGPSPFDDKSGNGNHPTNNGVTVTTVAAVTGQVARFVAADSTLLETPIVLGASYTTFAVIVLRQAFPSSGGIAGLYEVDSDGPGPLLFQISGGLVAYNNEFATRAGSGDSAEWEAGEAHSVAVKYDADAGEMYLYYDGALVSTQAMSPPTSSATIDIGCLLGEVDHWNDDVSWIAFWDSEALSDAEIAQLHSDHIGGE